MSESYNFDYYYGAESDQFSFVRIPKLLLSDPKFADLTYGAILTYGILLDRMGLSIKNGWHDENNRVYIRFKVEDLSEILGKSDDTVSGYLKELEKIGLVERDWRGAGKGKITYVKNFISPDLRDGEFITRINSGNGNPKTASNYVENVSDACNVDNLTSAKPSNFTITRENTGNESRENTGNISRENSVINTRENPGQNNTEIINNTINKTDMSNPSNRILSITRETVKAKEENRKNLSFATKFCSYASLYLSVGTQYPKYDDIVSRALPMYAQIYLGNDKLKIGDFKVNTDKEKGCSDEEKLQNRLNIYKKYSDIIKEIIATITDEKITIDELDHIVWYGLKGK